MSALIFDRTQADADRAAYLIGKIQRREMLTEAEQAEYNAGLRGCYNITDLNRVEAKVRELAETLRSYGYSVDYTVPMKGASVLPSGYTQLEYIESTGEQYIDTGVVANTLTSVAMNFEWLGNNTAWMTVFGSYDNGNYFSLWHQNTSDFKAYMGTSNYAITDSSKNISLELSATKFKINSTERTFSTTIAASSNLYLFHISNGQDSYPKGVMRLSSCIIYNGDTPIRIFISAKNASGTVGLYDMVNDTFYGNSGTGTFVAGPEISVLEDREWQYTDTMLESDVLLYLANIAALRDVIQLPPDVPPIPTIDRWIDWMAANDIERIVYELDRMIYGIVPLFRRCGTFRAGKNAQHLLLAKGVN